MLRRYLGIACLAGTAANAATAGPVDLPEPLTDADYRPVDPGAAELGQLLFYDPVISGNRDVTCASCHHPETGTSDGLSLGLGDGGEGLGTERRAVAGENAPEARIPRNAQALFNLGAKDFEHFFHDGRLEVDPDRASGFRTPMGGDMAEGFDSALSAQSMFPVIADNEMAGHYSENDVSRAVRQGIITGEGGAWDLISRRVAGIPDYARRFETVYGLTADEIGFTDISNAIAAFIAFEWRSDTAPFDAVLRGEVELEGEARRGMEFFYGEAGCSSCHSGPLLTDQGFHAMGDVQIGPGKVASFETGARDIGRMRVTGDPADAFAFRTPSLRNVELTAPYGHAGAFRDLRAYLRHHADPVAGLASYDRSEALLPDLDVSDWQVMDAPEERAAIAEAVEVPPVALDEETLDALLAFLHTLTDPQAPVGRLGVPESVPSGLPVGGL